MSVSFDEPADEQEALTGDQILGDDVYEWRSHDGVHHIKFGRPQGLVSIRVAKILGPGQAANPVLDAFYKAICSIREWYRNGQDVGFFQPQTEMHFEKWFGDLGDENLNAFVMSWQMALYGPALRAMQEAMDAGEGPEALARIGRNAGMQHSKPSRKVRSSGKPSS